MIKTLNKLPIEEKCLSVIKVTYSKAIANIIPNGEMLLAFPLRPGTTYSPPLCNIVLESLTRATRQKKEGKSIQIRKKEITLPLLTNDLSSFV
jgi:hypothetical protein